MKMQEEVRELTKLELLEEKVKCCSACTLYFDRIQPVFGEGKPDANIMIIGEAPGQEEDKQGKPFVGRSGTVLKSLLKHFNLTRENVFIANIIKCKPPKNRNPEPEEIKACIKFLHAQITLVQPKVLVLLGSVAYKSLFPKNELTITEVRGQWLEYCGIPTICTFHPAYILRNQTKEVKGKVVADFAKIIKKAQDCL